MLITGEAEEARKGWQHGGSYRVRADGGSLLSGGWWVGWLVVWMLRGQRDVRLIPPNIPTKRTRHKLPLQ